MKEFKLAVIYPKYLNANGDNGNIMMLKQRAVTNGLKFSAEQIEISDKIEPDKYDFFYIGGEQDEFNPIVYNAIMGQKDAFFKIKKLNKTLLGICFGYQILGKSYKKLETHEQLQCLGLLNFFTVEKPKRRTGNVTSRMAFMAPNYLVGFENHRGATYLEGGVNSLSYVDIGHGNNGSDKTEGVIENNIIGTYLTGPLLPRNVYFTDYLIKVTMEAKYKEEFKVLDEENTLEEEVHFDFIKAKY